MATFGHSRSDWHGQTDGAVGRLCVSGSQYLQDGVPTNVNVGVDHLGMILSIGSDNKSVVCVNVFCFVHGMVARAKTPCSVVSLMRALAYVGRLVLRSRG